MARKSKPAASSGDIPMWFMTYSDVITLLMTFFILLLTFATDQPEVYEQMKTSMFGGRGSVGIAGDNLDSQDKESLVLRMRPNTSRLTLRGTETPANYSDPAFESVNRGLKALEERSDLATMQRMSFETSLSSFFTEDGKLTSIGEQHVRLLTLQMRKFPLDIKFEVTSQEGLERVLDVCDLMTNAFKTPTGRISTALVTDASAPRHGLRITATRVD